MDSKTYETPRLIRVGSFEEVTQGNSSGTTTDMPIPTGFPAAGVPAFVASHLS